MTRDELIAYAMDKKGLDRATAEKKADEYLAKKASASTPTLPNTQTNAPAPKPAAPPKPVAPAATKARGEAAPARTMVFDDEIIRPLPAPRYKDASPADRFMADAPRPTPPVTVPESVAKYDESMTPAPPPGGKATPFREGALDKKAEVEEMRAAIKKARPDVDPEIIASAPADEVAAEYAKLTGTR